MAGTIDGVGGMMKPWESRIGAWGGGERKWKQGLERYNNGIISVTDWHQSMLTKGSALQG